MPLLFVYGTLKRGGTNHAALAGQRFAGRARTRPLFRLHLLPGYPGMTAAPHGGRSIEGEIWEVDPSCLGRLDRLEGTVAGPFVRAPVPLTAPREGLKVEGYLYRGSVAGRRDLGTGYAPSMEL